MTFDDAWITDLADRARTLTAPAGLSLVIEQSVVRPEPQPPLVWSIRIGNGHVEIRPGHADDADVSLRTDQATASEVLAGDTSAARAFLDGRIRLGGNVAALLGSRDGLDTLAAALRPSQQ